MEMPLPRRTLRKGTHSCTECKRRKIRCFFDQNSDTVCAGCQQRGSSCISQEFADVAMPRDEGGERLKRVEQMLEKITERLFAQGLDSPQSVSVASIRAPLSLPPDCQGSGRGGCVLSNNLTNGTHDSSPLYSIPTPASSRASEIADRLPPEQTHFALPKYADTCRILHAALPSQHDASTLFEAGRATAFVIPALCNGYAAPPTETTASLSVMPPMTAHPVILARKLLHVALGIQRIEPGFDPATLDTTIDLRVAMHAYHDLASSTVTCHDELLDSLEGLECLMCESVYLVDCGHLRQALACLRRASTLAQLMGFHRTSSQKSTVKQLDPATRVCGTFMWAHIAYLERYVALLLGLPTSITFYRFGTDEKLADQTDTAWFKKTQIDICEHIIRRNQMRRYDFSDTLEIDSIINRAAAKMPVDWWTPFASLPSMAPNHLMPAVVSAQGQIIHYNLLTVLHLPYLLRRNTEDQRFDYSRETCLFASREVLNRFILFRSIMRVVYCCRIVDFCAFTAAMTLLISHLSGRSQAQQRAADRTLVEKTLGTLDALNELNGDELSRDTAKLTRKLLNLEMCAAHGWASFSCKGAEGESADAQDPERELYLSIPYFGCIKLSVEPPGKTQGVTASQTFQAPATNSWARQASAVASFDSETPTFIQRVQPQTLTVLEDTSTVYHMANINSEDLCETLFDTPMPDIMAGAEDWAFQGVDTAFFDSLMGCMDVNQGIDWK